MTIKPFKEQGTRNIMSKVKTINISHNMNMEECHLEIRPGSHLHWPKVCMLCPCRGAHMEQ